MNSTQPLVQFNPKLPRLSKSEKGVLKLLVEAGKLISPLYLEQEKQNNEVKISEQEFQKAIKKDPSLLSPFTYLEKEKGKIIGTAYHIKYEKFLVPIAQKLNKAAELTDNKEFGKVLKVQANALLSGHYNEAVIARLKMKEYILDISIGPLDHFGDQLVFGKAPYHAWVGVLDLEGTKRYNNYKTITLSSRRKALLPKERIDTDKVKAQVLDVVLFSGLMARVKIAGISLPVGPRIVENYGTVATLFNQPNDLRIKEQILPTFNKIFSPAFREGYNKEDLRRGYLRTVALHELAHSYLHYKHAQENLKDLFPVIYELSATVLGLRMAGSLLLKDRITEKMLESMIVSFICRCFFLIEAGKKAEFLNVYVMGGTIFVNYMLENGALKRFEGLVIPNFTKMFVSLHDLSHILESLLSHGTRRDAENFISSFKKS